MNSETIEVSVHAIEEDPSNRTIALIGKKRNKEYSILVDGGSTHSFLDKTASSKLKCELVQSTHMKVLVANDNHLVSQSI